MIERFDPMGERHIAVIRLSLTNISQAYVGRNTKRADGLIPFLGLEREERYAEVLGHELAHAVHILTNLGRARLVEEVVQQTNEMLLSQNHPSNGKGVSLDLKRRLSKRDTFLKELEDQAEAIEKVVWTELTARKPERQTLLYPANR
jgi:nucleotide-binding universal stress UspA family protein